MGNKSKIVNIQDHVKLYQEAFNAKNLSKLQEETINIRRYVSSGNPMPEEVTSQSMI